jgi:hypothetical protein
MTVQEDIMKKLSLAVATSALALVLAGTALAADFSPTMEFSLSDTKALGNPELKIHVEQDDAAEEELAHVTLSIPKGFNLPADEAIEDGTELGTGGIEIGVGPACSSGPAGALPLGADASLPATLNETDRTDEQSDRGVAAVWTLDITGVTEIVLEVTGSKKAGWKLDGDIPANDFTCPPLVFDLTVNAKAGDVPILTNAKKPGAKVFSGTFTSAESAATVVIEQAITITK